MSEAVKHTSKLWSREHDGSVHFLYWCPGCGHGHAIPTLRWSFNGNVDSPTFSPSVRHFVTHPDTNQEETLCHYHVTDGQIRYCGDCKHALNGQTIDLQDIPADYGF